ncbi:MAG: hypothetical protein K0B14_15690, partial [Anaerolineaceae bacterium]|nr:hypothetical protein [Anaerolineaceae bacterium]
RIQVTVEINDTACTLDEYCSLDVNNGDIVKVTVKDPNFPITMPFLGVFIGKQTINLETTIQDQIIRVPKCGE